MKPQTEAALVVTCICGAEPKSPNPDCERCELVGEIVRLRAELAMEKRRAKFYRDRWGNSEKVLRDTLRVYVGYNAPIGAEAFVLNAINEWEAMNAEGGSGGEL